MSGSNNIATGTSTTTAADITLAQKARTRSDVVEYARSLFRRDGVMGANEIAAESLVKGLIGLQLSPEEARGIASALAQAGIDGAITADEVKNIGNLVQSANQQASQNIPSGHSAPNLNVLGRTVQTANEMKTWDVFFDRVSGTNTANISQPPPPPAPSVRRSDPIILDLNKNNQADITGANITGDGQLGALGVVSTVSFDLDLNDRQWAFETSDLRPTYNPNTSTVNAQAMQANTGNFSLPRGTVITVFDANGTAVRAVKVEDVAGQLGTPSMGLNLSAGQRADFRDETGQLLAELSELNGRWAFHHGNRNQNEWTKAWDATQGGDGFLVWDVDGDGKITSAVELFGETNLQGENVFRNGNEKLAFYFDKNENGIVEGSELSGLKIWEDRDGDGLTDAGELVGLDQHNIAALQTSFTNEGQMQSAALVRAESYTIPDNTYQLTAYGSSLVASGFDGNYLSSYGGDLSRLERQRARIAAMDGELKDFGFIDTLSAEFSKLPTGPVTPTVVSVPVADNNTNGTGTQEIAGRLTPYNSALVAAFDANLLAGYGNDIRRIEEERARLAAIDGIA
jgi:hypothetical protein